MQKKKRKKNIHLYKKNAKYLPCFSKQKQRQKMLLKQFFEFTAVIIYNEGVYFGPITNPFFQATVSSSLVNLF